MEERNSFVFFLNWKNILRKYPMEVRCAVYDAVFEYAESGTLPEGMSDAAMMAFEFIKQDIDRMQDKYEQTCEKRKAAVNKRWEKAGKGKKSDTKASAEYKSISDDTNGTKASEPIQAVHNDNDNEDDYESPYGDVSAAHAREAEAEEEADDSDDAAIATTFVDRHPKSRDEFCKNNRCTAEEFRDTIAAVLAEWRIIGWKGKRIRDGTDSHQTAHLLSAARIKLERKREQEAKTANRNQYAENRLQRRRGMVQVSQDPEKFKEAF
ncbi:MAG TPA: hypothetical protein DC009_07540 [Porphyromonadaceae bacterium]|nr:hypothetical protein [Porphyromonadaceae bacterium]